MKAKFIFESINFQRGIGSKQALSIGRYAISGVKDFEEAMKKTPFKLDWDFRDNSENEYNGVLNDDSNMTPLIVYSYDIPDSNQEKIWIELFHEDGDSSQLYVMVDTPSGVEDFPLDKFLQSDYHSLFESMNFERNIGPKAALKLGVINRIKEMIKEADKNPLISINLRNIKDNKNPYIEFRISGQGWSKEETHSMIFKAIKDIKEYLEDEFKYAPLRTPYGNVKFEAFFKVKPEYFDIFKELSKDEDLYQIKIK